MPSKVGCLVAGTILVFSAPLAACDLCLPQGAPLTQEKANARIVVFGRIVKSTLNPNRTGGTSELAIDHVIKNDEALKDRKSLALDRFLPEDPKTRYLVFVDVNEGELDAYRGMPFVTDRVVKYLENASPYDPNADLKVRIDRLKYYFNYLDDEDPEVAADAFREWAISRNEDVGHAARELDPKRLRAWLDDKKTPAVRLSLYAFLLGACGGEEDARRLRAYLESRDDRWSAAIDGVLAGYITLKPKEGWELTLRLLGDSRRSFTERLTMLRMLRFFRGYLPKETQPQILAAAQVMLDQPDMLDLIVEQLRQWQLWDKTGDVLAKYDKKAAPITRRAIIRYALSCPLDEAKEFIRRLEQDPAEKRLISEVAETIRRP